MNDEKKKKCCCVWSIIKIIVGLLLVCFMLFLIAPECVLELFGKYDCKSTHLDDAKSQKNPGVSGAVQQYSVEAVEQLRKAAEEDAIAQNILGDMYRTGQGVEQDSRKAIQWYRKAAEQKNAVAQNNLGYMYVNGYGVLQDYNLARKWCQEAAESGLAISQFNLGVMYANGWGVDQNSEKAGKWFRKAAEQVLIIGQGNLGSIYHNTWGVVQNYEGVFEWLRKAARDGYVATPLNLGIMYEKGEGVPQGSGKEDSRYCEIAKLELAEILNIIELSVIAISALILLSTMSSSQKDNKDAREVQTQLAFIELWQKERKELVALRDRDSAAWYSALEQLKVENTFKRYFEILHMEYLMAHNISYAVQAAWGEAWENDIKGECTYAGKTFVGWWKGIKEARAVGAGKENDFVKHIDQLIEKNEAIKRENVRLKKKEGKR